MGERWRANEQKGGQQRKSRQRGRNRGDERVKWAEIPGAEKIQGRVADGGGRGEERGRKHDSSVRCKFTTSVCLQANRKEKQTNIRICDATNVDFKICPQWGGLNLDFPSWVRSRDY